MLEEERGNLVPCGLYQWAHCGSYKFDNEKESFFFCFISAFYLLILAT